MAKSYNSDKRQEWRSHKTPTKDKGSQKFLKKRRRQLAVQKDEAQRLKSEKKRKWKRQEMQPKGMQLYTFSKVAAAARISVDLEIKVIKA